MMTEFSIWGDNADGKPLSQICNDKRGAGLGKKKTNSLTPIRDRVSTFGNDAIWQSYKSGTYEGGLCCKILLLLGIVHVHL